MRGTPDRDRDGYGHRRRGRGALVLLTLVGCIDPAPPAASSPPLEDAAGVDRDAGATPASRATSLPIEVLGPAGTEVAITIDVPASLVGVAELKLELVVDNVVDGDAAWVRIGDGTPIDLGAASTGLRRPFGGTARGTLVLPTGSVRAGENTLVFRYGRQIRDVSGFRVLAASIVGDGVASVTLPSEDPSSWKPVGDDAEIARGRDYFTATTRDGGPVCAKCHANDGADLAYFAFSSASIEARARHHSFASEEARAIASYIRSLPVRAEGRVYDPPFQPGTKNHGAAGAGHDAILAHDDGALASLFSPASPPKEIAWDVAASIDTWRTERSAAVPPWMRWLPRHIDEAWFTRRGGLLAKAEADLDAQGTLVSANAFQSAAIFVGKDVMIADGDHAGRVDILRYAAVKLWDWQRRHGGFDGDDHGFPDGGPAFPYEVGFAFFEAALADAIPFAMEQTFSWWVAQLAVNPGRGRSNGERPLNWRDVLLAAEAAGQGPSELTFLHLLGSREESRGPLAGEFGTDRGPVRLLAVPLRHSEPKLSAPLLRRFVVRESAYVDGGGALGSEHHQLLASAWQSACAALSAEERQGLRALARPAFASDLAACP